MEPLAHKVPDALRISGLSRTGLYSELKKGRIAAIKCGKRTLILHASLKAFIAGLPNYKAGA